MLTGKSRCTYVIAGILAFIVVGGLTAILFTLTRFDNATSVFDQQLTNAFTSKVSAVYDSGHTSTFGETRQAGVVTGIIKVNDITALTKVTPFAYCSNRCILWRTPVRQLQYYMGGKFSPELKKTIEHLTNDPQARCSDNYLRRKSGESAYTRREILCLSQRYGEFAYSFEDI